MPFGSEVEQEGVGLALSGGGFRAMLFHLGSLWRLNELGMLPKLSRISGVSGGSLLLGRLAATWDRLQFESGVARNFQEQVAQPILRFSRRRVDVPAVILGVVPFLSAAGVAASFYRRHLVGRATLQDLPDEPRFVFNATHLASAKGWRFSKPYMGCYRLGLIRQPPGQLAVAMAASAAFPPFLSPLTLSLDPDLFEETEGADLYKRRDLRRTVSLSDGGVYDNLGLETVWRRYRTVLASDAGGTLSVRLGRFRLWTRQLLRVVDTTTEQARALRRRVLIADFKEGRKEGTLWRTGTDVRKYPAACPFDIHPGWRSHLAAIRTRLNPFSEEERSRLVNWGYLVSDVALRSHVVTEVDPPPSLPFPDFGFSEPPPTSTCRLLSLVTAVRRRLCPRTPPGGRTPNA